MNIRKMISEDLKEIQKMMEFEGCTEQLDFKDNTYVLDDGEVIGFFHFRFEHCFPSLRHFCVRKDKRNVSNARKMIMFYKDLMKDFRKSIVNADKVYVCELIEKYFKVKPYAQKDNVNFYIVEV